MTKKDLIRYYQEIIQWDRQGSVLCLLNRSKINEFLKNNKEKIDTIYKKMEQIQKQYLVADETQENFVPKFEGEGENKKPIFIEGKLEIELRTETEMFLSTQIEIRI